MTIRRLYAHRAVCKHICCEGDTAPAAINRTSLLASLLASSSESNETNLAQNIELGQGQGQSARMQDGTIQLSEVSIHQNNI